MEYDYGEYPTMAAAGNGGVWCSVDELRKYVEAMKNCTFLDCETIKRSQTIWIPENWKSAKPPGQGFCWFIHGPMTNEKNVGIEHAGDQAGFRAHLMMFPDADLTVIWLSNNEQVYSNPVLKILTSLKYLK